MSTRQSERCAHSNNQYELEATIATRSILSEDINFYDELSEILQLSQWNHPTTFGQYGVYNIRRMGFSPMVGSAPNLPQPNVHLSILGKAMLDKVKTMSGDLPQPNVPLGNHPNDFCSPIDKK